MLNEVDGLSVGFKDGLMRVIERSPQIGIELLKGGKGGIFGKIAEKVKEEVDTFRSTLTNPDSKEQQQLLARKQAEISSKYYEEAWLNIQRQAGKDIFKMTRRPELDFEPDYQKDIVAGMTDMTKYLDISKESIKYALSGDAMENVSKYTYKTAEYAALIYESIDENYRMKKMGRVGEISLLKEGKGKYGKNKEESFQYNWDAIVKGTELNTESMYQSSRLSNALGIDSVESELKLIQSGDTNEAYRLLREQAKIGLDTKELDKDQESAVSDLFKVLSAQAQAQETIAESTKKFKVWDRGYLVDEAVKEARENQKSNKEYRANASESRKVLASLATFNTAVRNYREGVKDEGNLGPLESGDAVVYKEADEERGVESKKAEKDFKFGSGGWVLGSPGDILVEKDSLAMGLGAGFGGFANDAIRKMDPGSGGSTNNWGGITINVAANDAKDLRNAIPDIKRAMETFVDQKIKRHELKGKTKI